jgi:hypothetical protein
MPSTIIFKGDFALRRLKVGDFRPLHPQFGSVIYQTLEGTFLHQNTRFKQSTRKVKIGK